MSDIAIKVENLCKQYRIGKKQARYYTLRDTLSEALLAPFRRTKKLLQGQATGAAGLTEPFQALQDMRPERVGDGGLGPEPLMEPGPGLVQQHP